MALAALLILDSTTPKCVLAGNRGCLTFMQAPAAEFPQDMIGSSQFLTIQISPLCSACLWPPGNLVYNEVSPLTGECMAGPLELKKTLNLPKTDFSMKANLPQNEPKWLERWEQLGIYGKIRDSRKGAPSYVLHDGPPYANGGIHEGHALNKCLKDFVVKSKTMAGFDSPYVPGWDCHGLPIEIKVDE